MRFLALLLLLSCGARRVYGPAGTPGRTMTGEAMPELPGGRGAWIGDPVRLAAQRGKVVLVEFWTFG